MSVSVLGWSLGISRWRLILLITVSTGWPLFLRKLSSKIMYTTSFQAVLLWSRCPRGASISVVWCICPPTAELSGVELFRRLLSYSYPSYPVRTKTCFGFNYFVAPTVFFFFLQWLLCIAFVFIVILAFFLFSDLIYSPFFISENICLINFCLNTNPWISCHCQFASNSPSPE